MDFDGRSGGDRGSSGDGRSGDGGGGRGGDSDRHRDLRVVSSHGNSAKL